MSENTCEIRTGRLLEIRVAKGYETTEDVDHMISMIRACVGALPEGVRHVTIADWRACKVLTKSAATRVIDMMRGTNPRTERSVLLHANNSPTAIMQFVRLVRESDNEQRRVFSDVEAALGWAGEVLAADELLRARAFLASSG
ncbi:MAG TPA: hypothetical protein VJR89_35660 [Polyangiales bacterium]|nr:hypothetical protein [Polyangiales bacterium]